MFIFPKQAAQEGYSVCESEDTSYIFPEFLVPWLQVQTLTLSGLDHSPGPIGQKPYKDTPFTEVAAGTVQIPPNPPLTNCEICVLHKEISSLAEWAKFKFKDAAWELYFAEIAKLQAEATVSNAWTQARDRVHGLKRKVHD
ncbi:hypothetical protein DXG01_014280 [Tephrocybe rancida]|nr:hypothetical protein DXG01_014280 [Tephrocybe rancida]